MSCKPAELSVLASDADMELPIKSRNPAALLSHDSHIRFRIVRVQDVDDVEMKDV